jgi:hypothetical protein
MKQDMKSQRGGCDPLSAGIRYFFFAAGLVFLAGPFFLPP